MEILPNSDGCKISYPTFVDASDTINFAAISQTNWKGMFMLYCFFHRELVPFDISENIVSLKSDQGKMVVGGMDVNQMDMR